MCPRTPLPSAVAPRPRPRGDATRARRLAFAHTSRRSSAIYIRGASPPSRIHIAKRKPKTKQARAKGVFECVSTYHYPVRARRIMSGAQGAHPVGKTTPTTYESVGGGENRTRMELRSREDQGAMQIEKVQEKVDDAAGRGVDHGAFAAKKGEGRDADADADAGATGTGA
ncbi:hypothetical protein BS78_03G215500 [Paspalum vaginatum]|nr:hypothetical protein BS78_03G215500 [Paspalum vaginatum]